MELQIVWFVFWALLWMIYFALDGFDLGVGILIKILAKNENEKKTLISSIGPFWDGNEVWLITAGGATFAAFPSAYADMFSWFYIPLFLVLVSLIVRGVSVEFRNKSQNVQIWDNLIFLSSFFASFLFGVFFTNIWAGIKTDGGVYNSGLIGLLNIYGVFGGVVFCVLFLFHGLVWLNMRVEGYFKLKIASYMKPLWYISVIFFGLFIMFLPQSKNPNLSYNMKLFSMFFYALSLLSLYLSFRSFKKGIDFFSFVFSIFFILFFIGGGIISQYPYIIPFANGGGVSIFNSSASKYTLKLMTIVAVIFIPIVIAYQVWIYKLLYSKIDPEKLNDSY